MSGAYAGATFNTPMNSYLKTNSSLFSDRVRQNEMVITFCDEGVS